MCVGPNSGGNHLWWQIGVGLIEVSGDGVRNGRDHSTTRRIIQNLRFNFGCILSRSRNLCDGTKQWCEIDVDIAQGVLQITELRVDVAGSHPQRTSEECCTDGISGSCLQICNGSKLDPRLYLVNGRI